MPLGRTVLRLKKRRREVPSFCVFSTWFRLLTAIYPLKREPRKYLAVIIRNLYEESSYTCNSFME